MPLFCLKALQIEPWIVVYNMTGIYIWVYIIIGMSPWGVLCYNTTSEHLLEHILASSSTQKCFKMANEEKWMKSMAYLKLFQNIHLKFSHKTYLEKSFVKCRFVDLKFIFWALGANKRIVINLFHLVAVRHGIRESINLALYLYNERIKFCFIILTKYLWPPKPIYIPLPLWNSSIHQSYETHSWSSAVFSSLLKASDLMQSWYYPIVALFTTSINSKWDFTCLSVSPQGQIFSTHDLECHLPS